MIRETRRRVQCFIIVSAIASVGVPAAHAQSRPPRNPRAPSGQGTAGRTQLPTSGSLTLPVWLDDAETLDRGTASVELSVGRWSTIDGGETDGPIVDAAVGVN